MKRTLRFFREHPGETALVALGLFLRFFLIGQRSVWIDEAKTILIARAPWSDVWRLVRGLEGIPPLYDYLVRAWAVLFSDARLGVRTFSALCGALSLLLFAHVSRRFAPKTWRLALILAAVSSFWIHAAQDGRVYALFLLVAIFHLAAMLELLDGDRPRALAAYTACSIAGLWIHPFFAFLVAGGFAFGCHRFAGTRRFRSWLLVHAAVVLCFAPWLPSLRAQMALPDKAILGTPLTLAQLARVFGTFVVDLPFLDLLADRWLRWIGLLYLALLAVAGFSFFRRERDSGARNRAGYLLFQLVAGLVGLRLLEMISGPRTQARYLIYLTPHVFLLTALWLGDTSRAAWGNLGRRAARVLLCATLGAGTIGYFVSGEIVDPHLAEMSRALAQADARLPIIHLQEYYYLPLRYYYLPDRTHRLLCHDPHIVPWAALPGYPAAIEPRELSTLGPVLFVDPLQRIGQHGLGLSSGAEIAKFRCS